MIEQLLPYILNGAGGLIIGPIVSSLLGGRGGAGALAGIIGGLAGGYGMDAAGVGFEQVLSNDALMGYVSEFLNGGVGGGVLGGLIGLVMRR